MAELRQGDPTSSHAPVGEYEHIEMFKITDEIGAEFEVLLDPNGNQQFFFRCLRMLPKSSTEVANV